MEDAANREPSPLDAPSVIETPTDAELVDAAHTGDSFAITRLWQRHLSVAWRAARAATGRPDAEPVVVRTAERLVAELGDGGGPAGATRPHLLALTRQAIADESAMPPPEPAASAGGASAAHAPLELAPVETYQDVLPDGMGDGSAAAAAFAALPTRWQEALWLTEVDGLTTAELAAELGLTAGDAETMVADAQAALRAEWNSLRLAELPDDAECRTAAAASGRRARAHLDECPRCRVVAAPPDAVARRAVTTLPILLLGAGGGIAFLESVRGGASAAATEPVPTLAETAAETEAAADADTTPGIGRVAGLVALPAALVTALRTSPRRRAAAVGATLGGIAATTALVAGLSVWNGGGEDDSRILADPGSTNDVAASAPRVLPPVVVSSELPDAPSPTAPAPTEPDAGPQPSADAAPAPDAAETPQGRSSGAPSGSTPNDDQAAAPPAGTTPATGGGRTPVSEPAPPTGSTPITAELSRPGSNGWRTLTVTGEPGAPFTVSSGGEVLFSGVLDASGTATLQVRGTVSLDSLSLAYGVLGGTAYALTDGLLGSLDGALRSTETPAP